MAAHEPLLVAQLEAARGGVRLVAAHARGGARARRVVRAVDAARVRHLLEEGALARRGAPLPLARGGGGGARLVEQPQHAALHVCTEV